MIYYTYITGILFLLAGFIWRTDDAPNAILRIIFTVLAIWAIVLVLK